MTNWFKVPRYTWGWRCIRLMIALLMAAAVAQLLDTWFPVFDFVKWVLVGLACISFGQAVYLMED